MASAIPYLLYRAAFRIRAFLRDWYLGGFRMTARMLMAALESLDRTLALRITIRHLAEPLYGDRTILGYLIGVPFRLVRAALAAALYLCLTALAISAYLVWALIPAFIALYPTLIERSPLP